MSRSVLIVEDDAELQELYGFFLEGQDWDLVSVYDGYEALEHLQAERPDLILLDIVMDQVMGDELYRSLRLDPRFAAIPVIVLSVLPSDRLDALIDGDVRACYLRKPFQRRALIDAIETLVSAAV